MPRRACVSASGCRRDADRGIWRITDRAENGALAFVGIRQHRESLIAVRGDHDVVVGVAVAMTVADDTPCGVRSIEVTAQPSRIRSLKRR